MSQDLRQQNCVVHIAPSSVRPSVPSSHCCRFAAAGPAAIRHRSMHGRRSAAAAAALQHDMQQQMRGVPRCQLTQEVFVSDGPQDLEWWHRFRPVRPSVRAGRSILRRACEVASNFSSSIYCFIVLFHLQRVNSGISLTRKLIQVSCSSDSKSDCREV